MAIQRIANYLIYALNADSKPTNLATNALCVVVDTGDIYRWTGSTWTAIIGASSTTTFTNKSMVLASNTITDTSAALGDLAYFNGTRFVRFARGSTNQVLQSTATTIQWASFNAENTGKATASGNGTSTAFNIPHSIGATPSVASVQCSSHSTAFTYTVDATNITVTFTSAPASGTNNVIFYWRAVA